MHELGITEEIVRIILSETEQRSLFHVRSVTMTIGALTGYSPEAISYYYDILKRCHDCLRDSRLRIDVLPTRLTCNSCGAVHHLTDFIVRCPICDSVQTVRHGGNEVMITSIDTEEKNDNHTGHS